MRHNFSGTLNAEEYQRLNAVQGLTNDEIQVKAPSAFAGQAHDAMSRRYAFVPTSAIIDGMRKEGFLPVLATQSLARREDKQPFTKHMIRFRQQGAILNAVGDSVLETVLTNSHDGSSAYELSIGVFRLKCTNGLMVSEGLVHSVHIRHTGNIIDRVIESSFGLIKEAPKVAGAINAWRNINLTEPEQLILAEGVHSLRYQPGTPLAEAIKPVRLLEARRNDDNGADLWSTFNRVQENAIRGQKGVYVAGRKRTSREVKGIDQNIDLNKAIWTLAEKMAELKTN